MTTYESKFVFEVRTLKVKREMNFPGGIECSLTLTVLVTTIDALGHFETG